MSFIPFARLTAKQPQVSNFQMYCLGPLYLRGEVKQHLRRNTA